MHFIGKITRAMNGEPASVKDGIPSFVEAPSDLHLPACRSSILGVYEGKASMVDLIEYQ
tara:strand:+ start:303 stop:479 length:177 start_codon:yes stop_codon:yes gene_type:complete